MNFGILHLGQPEKALVEAIGCLRSGSRFAFSVWASPERNDRFRHRAARRGISWRIARRVAKGPPFFRYSDAEGMQTWADRRGFRVADREKGFTTLAFARRRRPFQCDGRQHGAHRGIAARAEAGGVKQIREAMRDELEKYTKGDFVELPMPALIAAGLKPKRVLTRRNEPEWARRRISVLSTHGSFTRQGPWCVAKGLESASAIIRRVSFSVSS